MNVYRTRPGLPPIGWPNRRVRGIWEVWQATRVDYPDMPEQTTINWTMERYRRLTDQAINQHEVLFAIHEGRKNQWK